MSNPMHVQDARFPDWEFAQWKASRQGPHLESVLFVHVAQGLNPTHIAVLQIIKASVRH